MRRVMGQLGPFARRQAEDAYQAQVAEIETYPLTQFFTPTYGKQTSLRTAEQKIRDWYDGLEWLHRSAIGIVVGLECMPSLHAHGVLIGGPNLCPRTAEALWHDIAGNVKVEAYDRRRSGVAYVLKEAYWTGDWFNEHLEYYSIHGRTRRPVLTRQYFNRHQQQRPTNGTTLSVAPPEFQPVNRIV